MAALTPKAVAKEIILFCFVLTLTVCVLVPHTSAQTPKPKITGIQYQKVSLAQGKVTFVAEISGENFGTSATGLTIELIDGAGNVLTKVTGADISSITDNKIVATVTVPLGTTITTTKLTFKTTSTETSDFKLTVKAPAKNQIKRFEIKHVTRKSPQFSNLYSLVITNDDGMFANNPNRMTVEVTPAGASNMSIRPGVNPFQMIVDFMAAADFQVQDVIVTVYDTTDLDARSPTAIAIPAKEKQTPTNPNQPTISNIEVVFLQRVRGAGRIKIEGNGFGNYPRPSCSTEDFINAQPFPPEEVEPPSASPTPTPTPTPSPRPTPCLGTDWLKAVRENLKVDLVPRNTDLQVKRSEITYADDKLIDIYFEFTRYSGYSRPFRLASATMTVRKPGTKVLQSLNDKDDTVTAMVAGPEVFLAAKEIGPKRDENVEYRFSVMDKKQASSLFGKGVSENFYVVQLSVLNKAAKKIAVPLAAIQAEIEWITGEGSADYLEGPATLPPIPLAGVSGFFDAYNKLHGKKATVFRILDGVALLGTSIIPFVGPGFKTSQLIYTGGLIPGLRLGFGDLSGQQLQNLTSLSWQNVEVIPAAGGSLDKYIYIPRNEQAFASIPGGLPVKKIAINIMGLEVVGFEIKESEPLTATPAPK